MYIAQKQEKVSLSLVILIGFSNTRKYQQFIIKPTYTILYQKSFKYN